ncbi:hypothetical protein SLA2020_026370 [Shorea laevis]
MASETDVPEISYLFERLMRHRDISLFLPFILGFTTSPRENSPDPDPENGSPRERIILINPFTQGMVVIEGTSSLESLLRGMPGKSGQPPASKAAIEAMPRVEIGGGEEGECVVCLEEWGAGEVVKEMPCNHRFHGECIEKWLGIHGSCPVCRYKMPVDEEEAGKEREDERRRVEREIWVSFSLGGERRSGDSDPPPSNSAVDDDVSSS